MKRVFAILLLALLPFQFSWAAVASYCEHERQGAGHFGHHEHRHDGQHPHQIDGAAEADTDAGPTDDAEASDKEAPLAMDLDCGHCHGQCGAMPSLSLHLPGATASAHADGANEDRGCAHAPTRPERPQWPYLA